MKAGVENLVLSLFLPDLCKNPAKTQIVEFYFPRVETRGYKYVTPSGCLYFISILNSHLYKREGGLRQMNLAAQMIFNPSEILPLEWKDLSVTVENGICKYDLIILK